MVLITEHLGLAGLDADTGKVVDLVTGRAFHAIGGAGLSTSMKVVAALEAMCTLYELTNLRVSVLTVLPRGTRGTSVLVTGCRRSMCSRFCLLVDASNRVTTLAQGALRQGLQPMLLGRSLFQHKCCGFNLDKSSLVCRMQTENLFLPGIIVDSDDELISQPLTE